MSHHTVPVANAYWGNSITGYSPIDHPPAPGYPPRQDAGRRTRNQMPERERELRRVGEGHILSVGLPIPQGLRDDLGTIPGFQDEYGRHQSYQGSDHHELDYIQYTAVTGDPDDFCALRNQHDPDSRLYSLRQIDYGRKTELLIVVTLYNEDENDFCRTMNGVLANIYQLCGRRKPGERWGPHSWKEIVICIVADGRSAANPGMLDVLAKMGIFQPAILSSQFLQNQGDTIVSRDVSVHLFEGTTLVRVPAKGLQPSLVGAKVEGKSDLHKNDLHVPVQIIFALKEKNAKKINSHRWCFNAFGKALDAKYVVLLDAGTRPLKWALLNLHRTFELNPNVGGCCGEIIAQKSGYFHRLLNPVMAATNFEYKMSNILDKSLESVFGFITVLPGAFCAYRMAAVKNNSPNEGPLFEYFKGEKMHSPDDAVKAGDDIDPHTPSKPAGFFQKNMYLAEDRVLCWAIVSKRGEAWVLKYQSAARAVTDVPSKITALIKQRRRWLNGSFFAGLHSMVHFRAIFQSGHGPFRILALSFQWLFQAYTMLFSWLALANYYIALSIISRSIEDPVFRLPYETMKVVGDVARWVYLALVGVSFILALGNKPDAARLMYGTIVSLYALIAAILVAGVTWIIVVGFQNFIHSVRACGCFRVEEIFEDAIFRNILLSILATLFLQFFASLLFWDMWHMFTSLIQYLLLAPSYINVLNVYAFANLHDHTWGTRPDEVAPAIPEKKQDGGEPGKASDGANSDYMRAVEEIKDRERKRLDKEHDDVWFRRWFRAKEPAKPLAQLSAKERKQIMKNNYKMTRTWILFAWAVSNTALVAAVTSTAASLPISTTNSSTYVSVYMIFLLYSIAALALIRAIGCLLYRIGTSGQKNLHRNRRGKTPSQV